ncbi:MULTISPECIES: phage late control D family protein [Cyanophyceae]|uniref:Contractile injection system protein, VgrG/Pvc8 family n=1 Tax=Leptolyngbya subtilissima DQ-A4 TaxID=2933933 RepID=A0ABV0JZJ3_9CYAN|nr:contractile injection system protein, VgrG/Pvc8 family [Nodosilinea sp. FACHB-141]MBD2112580.1 phage late control D family protein [Nodosilinea sp. FACHB-141]
MPQVKSGSDRLAPKVEILINSRLLETKAKTSVLAVEVAEDVEAVGMFTLELNNENLEDQKVVLSDDDQFKPGNKVEIKFGYGNQIKVVMVGEITGLEPEFFSDQAPRLIVRGHDLSHRLMRGTKTRSFTGMRDSDIVAQVAGDANLSVSASPTSEQLEYVLQRNQTDLAFIRDRASRIGYEILVEGTVLIFRPLQPQGEAKLTLDRTDLLEFSPRLNTLGQVNEVEVRGWDARQKEPTVVGKASDSNVVAMGKDTTSGIRATASEFGKTAYAVIDQAAASPQAAQTIAQGQINRMALSYITGEGACKGNAALQAGQVIKIVGLGQRFSGNYYVTATNHRYAVGEGYRTEFSVRRNATRCP